MEITQITDKLFKDNNVRIVGTSEDPLFVASDIGKVLEMKKINMSIKDYDITEKVAKNICTPGGNQNMTLLTEKGLYRILYSSHKK